MTISINWGRVASFDWPFAVAAGISNIGGRMVMVAGSTEPPRPVKGAVYISDDNGQTWNKGSDLALFTREGVGGSLPSDLGCGLLCYAPGRWLHPEDGDSSSSGDGGGILRHHWKESDPGTPVYNLSGYSVFGRPCNISRKDVGVRKFAIWPGGFLYNFFGTAPVGPLLLELTASGSTSMTTAFMRNQLDPTGVPYATVNPDGSISWLWVTNPPRIGAGTGVPGDLFTEGDFFFMLASYDGVVFRPHGDNQRHLTDARASTNFGNSYNYFTEAFFLRDGTLLCGVNVSGLSPCIFRSTARGMPGTMKEIVMPGNYFNYVPQGSKGSFLFSGLFVMTHCFCELEDGTVLCGGGAPTMTVPGEGLNVPVGSQAAGTGAFHHPQVWKSTDKGLMWQNVSAGVADFDTRRPLEVDEIWEARLLLALGGQAAFMACHVDQQGGAIGDPDWTPFFVTEDGGVTFQKSPVPREGFMAGENEYFYPMQTTFANDGSILVVLADWSSHVEIWRGTLGTTVQEHRAVGFAEQKDLGDATFEGAAIPEQELIRG
jgi:hypothetical protein